MSEQLYCYPWGNNSKRAKMKGRIFRVIVKGRMNTVLIEFVDNEERVLTSCNSLRKVKE